MVLGRQRREETGQEALFQSQRCSGGLTEQFTLLLTRGSSPLLEDLVTAIGQGRLGAPRNPLFQTRDFILPLF